MLVVGDEVDVLVLDPGDLVDVVGATVVEVVLEVVGATVVEVVLDVVGAEALVDGPATGGASTE